MEPASPPIEASAPAHDVAVVSAFLEQSREMARWHVARSETFERRAGVLLGFASVVLTLIGVAGKLVTDNVVGADIKKAMLIGLAAAGGGFVVSGFFALQAMRTKLVAYADRRQIVDQWTAYRDDPNLTEVQARGLFVNQLLAAEDGTSVVQSLQDEATERSTQLDRARQAFAVGFGFTAAVGAALIAEVWTH